ncbi:MAG: hypothetical protein WBW62_01450 [Solirubrobacterales bacterium]
MRDSGGGRPLRKLSMSVVVVLALVAIASSGSAQAGGPAPPPYYWEGDVVTRSDGTIFVSYYATGQGSIVVSYRKNGRINRSFRKNGMWVIDDRPSPEAATLAVQGRKLIVVARGTMYRLNPDGKADATFGKDGRVSAPDTVDVHVAGGILVARDSFSSYYGYVSNLSKFTRNGLPDPDFGDNGSVLVSSQYGIVGLSNVTSDSSGQIYVSGADSIARFDQKGSIDFSFGDAGVAETPVYPDPRLQQLVVSDGRITVKGYSSGPGELISRFGLTGVPDSRFGSQGSLKVLDGHGGNIYPGKDGGIEMAFGSSSTPCTKQSCASEIVISRFDPLGTFTERLSQPVDLGYTRSARQPDGKTLFATLQVKTATDTARVSLARLNRNGKLDGTFGVDGQVMSPTSSITCEGNRRGYRYLFFGEKFKREGKAQARVIGSIGPDPIAGGRGNDSICGRDGRDRIKGHGGRDHLFGQKGRDFVNGGSGRDLLEGGPGRDRIIARDRSRDLVNCGYGNDVAIVDQRDRVANCETVHRRPKP